MPDGKRNVLRAAAIAAFLILGQPAAEVLTSSNSKSQLEVQSTRSLTLAARSEPRSSIMGTPQGLAVGLAAVLVIAGNVSHRRSFDQLKS